MMSAGDPAALLRSVERALASRAGPRRALVVEDDPDLARILTTILAARGLETRHAGSARDAIRMSEALPPDVVVLDLGLPDLDGLEVVDWLSRQGHLARIPVAVYTAHDPSREERQRLRGCGAEVFIKGRVSPEALVERALEMIGRVAAASGAGGKVGHGA
ncbi:MAG: hypothetical protein QOK40_3774 [Miltoncostaeaceae bacterium]|nr:hypothetical protein [Miltoncostaeaceae bacterium]